MSFVLPLVEELRLELLTVRHGERLFTLIDANREHLDRWFPWVRETRTPADVERFLQSSAAKFAAGHGFDGILLAGDTPVGSMGVHDMDADSARAEVGYWLAANVEGRGYATRAVAALLPYLFHEMELNRVEIRCDPDNDRSRAVPERLGFREEGRLRQVARHHGRRYDHVVYGLLKDDWRAQRAQETEGPQ